MVGRVARVCQAWRLMSLDRALWLAHCRALFGAAAKSARLGRAAADHRARCIPVVRWLDQWDRRYAQAAEAAASSGDDSPERRLERVEALNDEKLCWACERGLAGLVPALLARRDPRYNSESPNPLLAAIVAGHTEVVECFFHQFTDAGAESWTVFIDSDRVLQVALDLAVWNGRTEIASRLLFLWDQKNFTPRMLLGHAVMREQTVPSRIMASAAKTGIEELVALLLLSGKCSPDALQIGCHAAVLSGNERVVDLFIRFGLDINSATPLSAAATVAMAQYLLDQGADPNHGCPLADAARGYRTAVARVLLRHGAEPNSLDAGGYAPLHRAVCRESVEMVELLLAHGADPGLRTRDGKSALWLVRQATEYDDMYSNLADLAYIERALLARLAST
ncbi:ankyrin repeat domain containing protein [Acanthamoeba castellanii str. Neff]|uniref:Ankyrin repeat domain containing protein n=1 Tax=Acanthamoeba castellanii (strain ATCC 30010 / Neff) TaxID=1257118 RepID=L8GTB9_ACACF|nr:ankyrin repeat domain containing protein [Acanthamoeba castellanii str. Neff]ELR15858.1 ankyrin repeat domain containing protein [Acanthamoeba castellanii str. Neff]